MNHYLHGIDCIGGGAAVKSWDNHVTFYPGDVVYFSQQYWRAVRQVDPPLVPAMMDGEVPGSSDAWRPTAQPDASVLGADSGFGMSSWMNAFKNLGGKKAEPATLPPSAELDKHVRSSAGEAALYTGLGVFGVAVAGLVGYLALRKKRRA